MSSARIGPRPPAADHTVLRTAVRLPARPGTRTRTRTSTRARSRPRRAAPTRRRPAGSPPRARVRRRGSRPGWWPAALVLLGLLAGIAWQADATSTPAAAAPARCTASGSGLSLTQEQADNAAAIAGVARDRGLPTRALVIALATAEQESHLHNLRYGDRDSLGLFQQRPSQGWGTAAQVQDPAYAAGRFFDHLLQIPGWQTARLTDVAQAVQRSAAPEAYQKWEGTATALATALTSTGPGRLHCPG